MSRSEEIAMPDNPKLQILASMIKHQLPKGHGFILLTFPFEGSQDNIIQYVSNGQREDVIKALKEFLLTQCDDEWLSHIEP